MRDAPYAYHLRMLQTVEREGTTALLSGSEYTADATLVAQYDLLGKDTEGKPFAEVVKAYTAEPKAKKSDAPSDPPPAA